MPWGVACMESEGGTDAVLEACLQCANENQVLEPGFLARLVLIQLVFFLLLFRSRRPPTFGSCSRLNWRFQPISDTTQSSATSFAVSGLLGLSFPASAVRQNSFRGPCTHITRKLGLT